MANLESADKSSQRWFLQLSDIHFRKVKADDYDPYDLDADLRDQLELDVQRVREHIGVAFYGIILSGDAAFAGRGPEFDDALVWLRKLSGLCRCEPENVYCVPGNHDVDRLIYEKSVNLRNLHNTLRPAQPENVDAILGEALRDSEAAQGLFRPLEQYNRFAARFSCTTTPDALVWEHRVRLNDGSMLVLRGANSALVSDSGDDNKTRRLILGSHQATARERPEEVVVFVCHHPLDWLLDYDQLTPILNGRSRVQLFGHKHRQIINETDGCLRIVAGAIHPDRREPNWRPRYNCLGFSVLGSGNERRLIVDIYPRVWSNDQPKFVADYERCEGRQNCQYSLKLPEWKATVEAETPAAAVSELPVAKTLPTTGVVHMDPGRTLTYRFLSLPHIVRLEIAQQMALMREEDEGILDAKLFERILARASNGNRLAELWDLVEARHDDKSPTNPYAQRT